MNPWKRKEVIGDCTLYLGDCLEILPTLEKVDAVITDDIMGYEKSTGRERSKERTSGGALGITEGGDCQTLPSGRAVSGGSSDSLRGSASGDVQGVKAPRHQGEVSGAKGRCQRALHSRDGEHNLSQDGQKESVRGVRSDRESLRSPQERQPSGQPQRESASALLTMPQQAPQKRVLGKAQGFVVVTDPPYEIRNKFGESDLYGKRRMEFHFDEAGVTDAVVIPALRLAFDAAQSFHVFCDPEQYSGIAGVARALGFTPKPFAKIKACPPPPMPGNWWPSGFELAMYGYRSGAYFGDQTAKRVNLITADSYRFGIRSSEKADHPTQKWLPMMVYLVKTLSEKTTTILDPFMGSGTTGVACANLGKKFIGIEIEPKYFDIACERITNAYRQERLFA